MADKIKAKRPCPDASVEALVERIARPFRGGCDVKEGREEWVCV